ncbi:MAG: hypothetical protein JW843_07030 [Candidatus Aminicenantes bacterium]|nr:hypothetical protein [Candidatus Aminicenantes bacterium]
MKKSRAGWIAVLLAVLASSPPPTASSQAASQEAVDALKKLSVEVQRIVSRDNVRAMYDRTLKLKEMGFSFQAGLLAPRRPDPSWSRCRTRQYAGMKLFDMGYAVAFLKRGEAIDCVEGLEAVFSALDLRSHADWSGRGFNTMRRAADDPESIDPGEILNELVDNLVDEIPTAMSSPETAHYLLDALFGFSIQSAHVAGTFQKDGPDASVRERLYPKSSDAGHESWMSMVLRVFAAFEVEAAKIGLKCEATENLGVIREIADLVKAEAAEKLGPEDRKIRWDRIGTRVAAARAAILSTGSR